MQNDINSAGAGKRKISWSNLIVIAFTLATVMLAIVVAIVDKSDSGRSDDLYLGYPDPDWQEHLTPEERSRYGFDRMDAIKASQSSGEGRRKRVGTRGTGNTRTDFDEEDYYDLIDYYGGLDGEFSDIDYHDIEEIHAD